MKHNVTQGQVFSLIAILMSALFILLFSGLARIPLDDDVDKVRAELFVVSDYINSMQSYIESATDTVGYKILNFSDGYIQDREGTVFFDDYEAFFESCFENGTFIDPEFLPAQIVDTCGGADISFPTYFSTLLQNADNTYNLESSFDNFSVQVGQEEPYSIDINVTVHIKINKSATGTFSWEQLFRISRRIDIRDMVDPATLGTDHVRRFNYQRDARGFSIQSFNGDLQLLSTYIANGYYFTDSSSPSFVARMQGERADSFVTYNNSLGISSVIPPINNSFDSLYVENRSMLAHHYDAGLQTGDCSQLRRIDHENVSHNLIFRIDTLTESLGVNTSDFLTVCGCCDESGCTSTCG